MSPSSLRRYRAERLLRRDFVPLRSKVLATVRSRLGVGAGGLDMSDLEACYAQAWHGLYTAMLEGREIANPAGWLVTVTLRRALDERRARHDARRASYVAVEERGSEPDMPGRVDDSRRLREVFEGLRERLGRRECEAATLCYLHGLSRAEAASRMGVSERRMRKLMEGDGRDGEGVARKVGELLAVVRAEGWCAERGSMMRALAYGVLDPDGERYRLALAHQRECPACRRYVLSLRGLAAILPPLALPAALGGAVGAGAGAGTAGSAGGSAGWLPAAGSVAGKLAAGTAALGVGVGGVLVAAGGGRSQGYRGDGHRPAPIPGILPMVLPDREDVARPGVWRGQADSRASAYAARARRRSVSAPRTPGSDAGRGQERSHARTRVRMEPPAAAASTTERPSQPRPTGARHAGEFSFE